MSWAFALVLGVSAVGLLAALVALIAFLRVCAMAQRYDDDALRDAGYTDNDIERMHRQWDESATS